MDLIARRTRRLLADTLTPDEMPCAGQENVSGLAIS